MTTYEATRQDKPDVTILQNRELFFHISSATFSPPNELIMDDIISQNLFIAMNRISSHYSIASQEMISGLEKSISENPEILLNSLQAEYVSLFVASSNGVAAPPYGSFYLEGAIMGESTQRTLEAYKVAGFALNREYRDLPDHIAAEFEFLCHLARWHNKEAMELSLRFLEENLLRWFPQFAERVSKSANLEFYRMLSSWIEMLIRADAAFLRETLDTPYG